MIKNGVSEEQVSIRKALWQHTSGKLRVYGQLLPFFAAANDVQHGCPFSSSDGRSAPQGPLMVLWTAAWNSYHVLQLLTQIMLTTSPFWETKFKLPKLQWNHLGAEVWHVWHALCSLHVQNPFPRLAKSAPRTSASIYNGILSFPHSYRSKSSPHCIFILATTMCNTARKALVSGD